MTDSSPRRRPAIVAVDDEPAVLAAVSRDLRRGLWRALPDRARRLGRRGARPPAASSAPAASRSRCWSPTSGCRGCPGTDYLVQARKIVPEAKRVLLTAYADTEAAIQAINEVSLDYYLLKPWDPPEEQLFPVVEDLLTTWEAGAALESGGRARDRPPLLQGVARPARLPRPQPGARRAGSTSSATPRRASC